MLISTFDSERDRDPKPENLTWGQIQGLFTTSIQSPCTLATCGQGENMYGGKPGQCAHKYGKAWSPAAYPSGATRGKKNVGSIGLLVLDLDHMTSAKLDESSKKLAPYNYVAHASHSNAKPTPSGIEYAFRFIIELSEPVMAADWPRFWIAATEELGGHADPATCDASRLYFMPSHRADSTAPFMIHEGGKLDVKRILAIAPKILEVVAPMTPSSFPPASSALLERARDRLRAIGPAIEGQNGDNTTYSACAAMLHDFALSDAEAWPLLVGWNQTNVPTWDLTELQLKMSNARSYADGVYGAGRAAFDASEKLREMFKIPATPTLVKADGEAIEAKSYPDGDLLSALGVPDDVIAAPDEGEPGTWAHELNKARRDVAAALGTKQAETSAVQHFESAAGLFDAARLWPQTPWLARGLIAEGGVVAVIGEPKSTKSWIALDIALAIASKTKALGEFEVPNPRPVAYFFAEDLAISIRNRIRAFAAGRGARPEDLAKNLHVQPRGHHLDVTRDEDLAGIVASCRMLGPLGMLVLDPLRDIHSGKENESDDMSAVFARLRMLATLLGTTVLIVHHSKKPSKDTTGRAGNDIRGSSAIYGALDGIIALRDLIENPTPTLSTFVNTVKCEVKGAKSAGTFALTLGLQDDEHGTAISAVWKFANASDIKVENATTKIGTNAVEDAAIELLDHLALVATRKEPSQNTKTIRKSLVMGTERLAAAIAYASGKDWLRKGGNARYELTASGWKKLKTPSTPPPTDLDLAME